jgi:hypothetical protein
MLQHVTMTHDDTSARLWLLMYAKFFIRINEGGQDGPCQACCDGWKLLPRP